VPVGGEELPMLPKCRTLGFASITCRGSGPLSVPLRPSYGCCAKPSIAVLRRLDRVLARTPNRRVHRAIAVFGQSNVFRVSTIRFGRAPHREPGPAAHLRIPCAAIFPTTRSCSPILEAAHSPSSWLQVDSCGLPDPRVHEHLAALFGKPFDSRTPLPVTVEIRAAPLPRRRQGFRKPRAKISEAALRTPVPAQRYRTTPHRSLDALARLA